MAGQPGLWMLLVLTTGKPFAHTSKAPHGSAVTLLAFPIVGLMAIFDKLNVGTGLHATDTGLQLL